VWLKEKEPAGRRIIGKLHDRDRSLTQKRSLIAASFRTWRVSWPSVARRPIRIAHYPACRPEAVYIQDLSYFFKSF